MRAVDGHAFISYVREDAKRVDRLQAILEDAGVRVWRDTADLWPGEDWRAKIRQAVTSDALVFLACFSSRSVARMVSGQNAELNLAVEQLRLRRPDQPWLIPVRFDQCEVPEFEIGGDRTLRSIQRVDLIGDNWENGIARLLPSALRILDRSPAVGTSGSVSMVALGHSEDRRLNPRAESVSALATQQIAEAHIRSSVLWRQTLATREAGDPHGPERERLRHSYLSLRSNVATLLTHHERVPNLTARDVSHLDALWEAASLLCGDDVTLNPVEAYVLGCAFAFHDASMGLAAATEDVIETLGQATWRDLASVAFVEATGRWATDDELDDLPADIFDTCLAEAVPRTHAARAAALVARPSRLSSDIRVPELYLIEDAQLSQTYGPLIGELAGSPWIDIDGLAGQFGRQLGSAPWQPEDWTIDPLKLACILRLADAVQIDSTWIPSFLLTRRDPQRLPHDKWRFHGYIGRPQLIDDRISYSSMRPFGTEDAEAWWLALDYLRAVDHELKRVDSLLHDLHMPRLAARAVAFVDRSERFAEVFPVTGWQPVDADIRISDIRGLVMALGGEQLYGQTPEVAVRELIQNAQDAVLAREAIDPDFDDGQVVVSLEQYEEEWILEVRDNGIGMDEDILIHGLLDFGATGWRTDTIRSKFEGLTSGGFRPRGVFGIGFYSVFMLGDDVSVVTRRFDAGQTGARQLNFGGLAHRPILTALPPGTRVGLGTVVRVVLKKDPRDPKGLFDQTYDGLLNELVQRLVPNNTVPITTNEKTERHSNRRHLLPPLDLASASVSEVFKRLYPPSEEDRWMREVQHRAFRDEFCEQATEVLDDNGKRLGLAAFEGRWSFNSYWARGLVVVGGFGADRYHEFAGYLSGTPSRASRDKVELSCSSAQLATWIASQEQRLRERGKFTPPVQLELALTLYRAKGTLEDDHHIAMVSNRLMQVGDIESWASERNQIFFAYWGGPIDWELRPPGLWHSTTVSTISIPDNWIFACPDFVFSFIDDSMLPDRRDTAYIQHKHDKEHTWQKRWWSASGSLEGFLIRKLCRAWSCTPADLLAPAAERDWDDTADLGIPGADAVPGLHLRRP